MVSRVVPAGLQSPPRGQGWQTNPPAPSTIAYSKGAHLSTLQRVTPGGPGSSDSGSIACTCSLYSSTLVVGSVKLHSGEAREHLEQERTSKLQSGEQAAAQQNKGKLGIPDKRKTRGG